MLKVVSLLLNGWHKRHLHDEAIQANDLTIAICFGTSSIGERLRTTAVEDEQGIAGA